MTDDLLVKAAFPAPAAKRQAVIVIALVFLAGLLIGIAGDRLWLTRHWGRGGSPGGGFAGGPRDGPGGPPGMMRGGFPPGMSPEHAAERRREVVKRLTRELDLSEAQQHAVDSIMASNEGEFRALEQEIRPRMRSFLERTRAQIDSVLTPGQRERFHRFGPPDAPLDGPGGPPPPGPER